jgi:hypothetical protein
MTAQDYINKAIARSYRNRGEVLAPEGAEMLVQLGDLFVEYYLFATGLNPAVFATTTALSWNGTGWDIPANCDTMIQLRTQAGTPITVVAVDNLDAEPTRPCVYRLGRHYFPAGLPSDPGATGIVAFYTLIPEPFASLAASPGAEWPAQYDTMVVVDLAMWLAAKDGRTDDVAEMLPLQQKWAGRYTEWCSRESLDLVRQWTKLATSPNVTAAKVAPS